MDKTDVYRAIQFVSMVGISPVGIFWWTTNKALRRRKKFSPALGFAHEYCLKFLAPLGQFIRQDGAFTVDGMTIARTFVIAPESSQGVTRDLTGLQKTLTERGFEFSEVVVNTPEGYRTLWIRSKDGQHIAFDVPRIASGIDWAISQYLHQPEGTGGKARKKLEAHEFRIFNEEVICFIEGQKYGIRVTDCDVADLTPDTPTITRQVLPWWRAAWRWVTRPFSERPHVSTKASESG